jgi:hypothetical protein
MSTPDPTQKIIDDAFLAGLRLARASDLSKNHDDSVGAAIGNYDDHMRFLDWCEFVKGYDPDVCFSNIRSWEDKEVHEKAWELFAEWEEWQSA